MSSIATQSLRKNRSSAAIALLSPGNAIVRVLLPEGSGFLTVAWKKDTDSPDGKIPVAKDLMRKVLTVYSKRVLGLTTLETNFERRAALDFRKRRATNPDESATNDKIYNLYCFVIVKGTDRTIFKPTQPLVTLFNAGGDGKQPMQRVTLGLWRSNWQKDKSAKKPRRRTIATPSPRQLVLGRRLLAGDSNTGDSAVRKSKQYTEEDDEEDSGGEDEALDDGGWENWNGVRVVSHRVSLKDGWKDMKSTSDEGGGDGGDGGGGGGGGSGVAAKNQRNGPVGTASRRKDKKRRRQTVDSGHVTTSSIKLSVEIAQMIQETGVVRDRRCTMLNMPGGAKGEDGHPTANNTNDTNTTDSDGSHRNPRTNATNSIFNIDGTKTVLRTSVSGVTSPLEDDNAQPGQDVEDEWGFNTPSPWSRQVQKGHRSRFSTTSGHFMLSKEELAAASAAANATAATPTHNTDSTDSTKITTTTTNSPTTNSTSTTTPKSTTTATPTPAADPIKRDSHKNRGKGPRRRNHRRRMSALTDSSQHLLDDSLNQVLSMTGGGDNKNGRGNNDNHYRTDPLASASKKDNKRISFVRDAEREANLHAKVLHQPVFNAPAFHGEHDVATLRIQRIRQQIRDAEEFVACLPSVSFDVIKVNQRGRKQRRVLRVTSSHVLNCKVVKDINDATKHQDEMDDDDEEDEKERDLQPMMHGGKPIKVTKSHHFDDVRNVTLKSHDALLLQYHNDHDFTYKSPVASSILHEVGTRIAVAQATKKKRVQLQIAESLARRRTRKRGHERLVSSGGADSGDAFGHQMTSSLSEKEMLGSGGGGSSTHEENKEREVGVVVVGEEEEEEKEEKEKEDEDEEDEDEEDEEEEIGPLVSVTSSSSLFNSREQKQEMTPEERKKDAKSRRASKLAKLTGETEEQRLEVVLRRVIYNPSSDVGRTRTGFLNSFVDSTSDKSSSESLQFIRFFIDGMQQYIMQHHANDVQSELGRLLVEVSFTDDHVDKRSNTSLVLETRSSGSGKTTLSEIVMKSCEASLFPHLWDEQVVPLLASLVDPKEEQALVDKMAHKLEGLPQSFFEIPKGCESPSRWSAAALEMAGISSAVMPTDKLAALLRAAKVIYGTYAAEKELRMKLLKKRTPKGEKLPKIADELGADEFLPIFIFVTVHAELESPLKDKECMWSLCEPDMVAGEGGYYLTVFDAALSYLKVCDSSTT